MSPEDAVEALLFATKPLTRSEVQKIVAEVRADGYEQGMHDGILWKQAAQ
jgi:hypothetical protein